MEREFGAKVGFSNPGAQSQMHRVESPILGDASAKPVEEAGPSTVTLPSYTTQKERDNIMDFARVMVTGSVVMGKKGTAVGLVDIRESDDAYYFRVLIPGVPTNDKDFSLDIKPDCRVLIKGVTTTGEGTVFTGFLRYFVC